MKYFAPTTLKDAQNMLMEEEFAHILAGGTDLLVEKRSGKLRVEAVVDIKRIVELDFFRENGGVLEMGPLVTVNRLLRNGILPSPLAALLDASRVFGCYEIRNRATIAGNIAHASPGAEFGATLVALDATITVSGPHGERSVAAREFFRASGKSVLERGEVITRMGVPIEEGSSSAYVRASRVDGMDLAVVNCAVKVSGLLREGERRVNVCFGAVADVPLRVEEVERLLCREKWGEGTIHRAKIILMERISPRTTSIRARPHTKRILAGSLLEEALTVIEERLRA